MRPSGRSRGEREPLRVAEVAGVLERDLHAASGWRRARGRTSARNSPTSRTFAANVDRALVAEQPAELLQVRAAAGRVDDDQLHVLERGDQRPRERLALLEPAGVDRERAAAALRRGDDLEAVRREDARGRSVHVREDRALDAAGEETDAARAESLRAA